MKKLLILIIILVLAIVAFVILNIINSILALNSGIEGKIIYGPTEPVCTINEPCSNPYTGEVLIKSKYLAITLKTFETNDKGEFKVNYQPGTYYLETKQKFISSCRQLVNVEKNKFTNITLDCDSGIR